MKYAVLDIEHNAIKAVIADTGKLVVIEDIYYVPIPKEIKSLEDKKIYIKEKIADILNIKDFLKNVFIIAKGTDIVIRNYNFPIKLKNDLREAVKWKVVGDSHLNENSAVISFNVNKQKEYKYNNNLNVTCAAADFSTIKKYFDYFSFTPYRTPTIALEAEGVREIMRLAENYSDEKTIAGIYIGISFTNVVIIKNGILLASRVIPTGDENFTRVLAGETVVDGKTITVSLEQAEILKKDVGISIKGDEKETNSAYNLILPPSVVKEMLQSLLDGFTSEIERFFKFYKSEYDNNTIDLIYVFGPGTNLKNIEKYVENRLAIKSELLSLDFKKFFSLNLDKDKENIFNKKYKSFLPSLGILSGEKYFKDSLKLYEEPSAFEKTINIFKKYNALFLGIIFLLGYFFLQYRLISLRNQSNKLENKWKNFVKNYRDFFILQGIRTNQNKTLVSFNELRKYNDVNWNDVFRELSLLVPDGLVFFDIHIESEINENEKKDYIMKIKGIAVDLSNRQEEIITDFILKMNNSKYFRNVDISYTEKDVLDSKITHFEVISHINAEKK